MSNHALGVAFDVDFNAFVRDFEVANGVGSFAAVVRAIPEPSSLLMCGWGLVGLALLRPRRAGQLSMAAMILAFVMLVSVPANAVVIWESSFETENDLAVVDDQIVSFGPGAIDNNAGAPDGTAEIHPEGGTEPGPQTYQAYSDIGAIPASVDPLGVTGSFALLNDDDVTTEIGQGVNQVTSFYIDTNIPSSAVDELTAEGFFYRTGGGAAFSAFQGRDRMFAQRRSAASTRVSAGIQHPSGVAENKMALFYTLDGGAFQTSLGPTTINDNQWYHWALVVDKIADENYTLSTYLNGVLEVEETGVDIDGGSIGSVDTMVLHGFPDFQQGLDGYAGHIFIHDTVLGPSEFIGGQFAIPPDILGDFDGDGTPDVDDFNTMVSNLYRHIDGVTLEHEDGDITLNGQIDLRDFKDFKARFPAVFAAATGVPEPTTIGLVLVALVGLVSRTRCRR